MATRGVAILRGGVAEAAATAATAERLGYHSAWSPEFYTRSAVVSLAAMAQTTSSARIGSSIAYATGRTPLVLATEARSLDELSGGRLAYGLGTGTTRMMADWHGVDPAGPASRMEELLPLLRRLWRLHEGPVRHHGRFYHVDVTPTAEMTAPARAEIPLFTAGVNSRMVQVAGRVADGFLGHPLFTLRYYDKVVRPAIEAGAARAGRAASRVEIAALVICSAAEDETQARREAAAQISFYAAPRTYATVLDVAGFAAAGERIRAAFGARDFGAMAAAVPDEMIDAMSAAGTASQVAAKLAAFGRHVDHLIVYPASFGMTDERSRQVTADLLRAAAPAAS
ncbi:MAG TPA: LLM class flavin-dependent oxidoreductase [Streptosporangiaceae bacterium]|jgi:probable F420-dependent oxidoreductase